MAERALSALSVSSPTSGCASILGLPSPLAQIDMSWNRLLDKPCFSFRTSDRDRLLRRALGILPMIAALSLSLITGCATAPTSAVGTSALGNQPQTLLAGAQLDQARSVAMASARSKGWTIIAEDQGSLVLEREIPRSAPQAVALGATPHGPAPRMRVRTDLVQENDGTYVGLRAFVIIDPNTETERQLEFTDDYQDDLAVSLSSLQSAWLATGHRLASPAPVPEAPVAPVSEDVLVGDTTDTRAEEGPASAHDQLAENAAAPAIEDAPPPEDVPWREQNASWPAPDFASSAPEVEETTAHSSEATPRADRSSSFSASGPRTQSSPPNQMLVLDAGARTGIWAYYAERFAQTNGCSITERGAVLLQKTPAFELHEVECANRSNLLVKCQGGLCGGIR